MCIYIYISSKNSLHSNWILPHVLMHSCLQPLKSPLLHFIPMGFSALSASGLRLVAGGARWFPSLSSLLTYPANFHCYPFIVIKFIGEKDGIVLGHN